MWVLHPLEDLAHTRIDKVRVLTTVDGRVHLGTCPLCLPSVYVGSGADEAKYNVFDEFTKSHLGILNVFVWTVRELRMEATLVTKSQGKRKAPADAVFLPSKLHLSVFVRMLISLGQQIITRPGRERGT